MSRALRLTPAILLILVVAALIWRLGNPADPKIRSKLVGQAIPQFSLPPAIAGKPGLASADFRSGEPRLLNLFASWCVPCIAEAPMLEQLKRRGARIDAVAIRDRSEDVAAFLTRHGDPFEAIGSDPTNRVAIALGTSGVPESFVVDGRGVIRYQHIGPIMAEDIPVILAELDKAR